MRKNILLGVIFVWAPVLLAGGDVRPLNIKTGLWQVTMTSEVSGRPPMSPDLLARMTPEQRAKFEAAMKARASQGPQTKTYKNCITKEKLNKDPFGEARKSCTRTVLASTGSKMDVREVCVGQNGKRDMTIRIEAADSEHVTGSGQVNAAGGNDSMKVSMHFTGKWIGAVCSADKK